MKRVLTKIFSNVLTKIPVFIAILISLVSFGFVIKMLSLRGEPLPEMGNHPAFNAWIFSVIFALISIPFYLIDAVFSIIKSILKIHLPYNIVLATIILISPIILVIFGATAGYGYIVWNVYYLLLFVLEIVSFILCIITTVKHKEKTP